MLFFIFAIRKILQMSWKTFWILPLYIFEKNVLINKYRKQMCNKKDKYIFDVMQNGQNFSSKFCHFQYDDRLLFTTEMGNIKTGREVRLQKLKFWSKLVLDSICLAFFKLLKNEKSFGNTSVKFHLPIHVFVLPSS